MSAPTYEQAEWPAKSVWLTLAGVIPRGDRVDDGYTVVRAPSLFRFRQLLELGVPHGVTKRVRGLPSEGDVGFRTADTPDDARRNRRLWWQAAGLDWRRTVCARQVHGTTVALVREEDAGRGADDPATALPATDGLVTAVPGIPLAVFCADCAPVVLYDPVNRVAGVAHAGWRGTVNGIVLVAVDLLVSAYGSDPYRLRACIGPTIGACCYEVGAEVLDAWRDFGLDPHGRAVVRHDGSWAFDLVTANQLSLAWAGVPNASIEVAGICTRCRADECFSYRAFRAGHRRAGHMAAFVAVPR